MKKKKRALTLIEIFIYFSLSSSIVATLLYSLKNNTEINFKLNNAKTDIMQRERIQQRLGSIFFSLSLSPQQNPSQPRENLIHLKKIAENPYLSFYFNNRVDPEPAFCNKVKGVLQLTQEGTLHLTIKSMENDQERKETLLSGIQKLELKFLFQDSAGTFIEIDNLENSDQAKLKAIKLLAWETTKKPLVFVFWLPFKMDTIHYLDMI